LIGFRVVKVQMLQTRSLKLDMILGKDSHPFERSSVQDLARRAVAYLARARLASNMIADPSAVASCCIYSGRVFDKAHGVPKDGSVRVLSRPFWNSRRRRRRDLRKGSGR
jgi:hypothetical protein